MRKGIQLLVVVFIIQTIASCCRDVEFFDYDSMTVSESDLLIENGENLELLLLAENLEYLSYMLSQFGHNQSIAFSCDEGWGGMKYRITDISIISDSDFNSSHTAGSLLDDLFTYSRFLGDGQHELVELTVLDDYSSDNITLTLKNRPTNDLTHKFSITITKSNGETIEVESDTIEWL